MKLQTRGLEDVFTSGCSADWVVVVVVRDVQESLALGGVAVGVDHDGGCVVVVVVGVSGRRGWMVLQERGRRMGDEKVCAWSVVGNKDIEKSRNGAERAR